MQTAIRLPLLAALSLPTMPSRVRSAKIQMQENTMTNSSVRDAWSVFAELFAAEAGECRIPCSAFSLPKLVQFLCTGRMHLLPLSDHAGSFLRNNSNMQVESLDTQACAVSDV